MRNVFLLSLLLTGINYHSTAQTKPDSIKLNMPAVFGFALNGNIPEAIKELNSNTKEPVIKKHAALRTEMNLRFAHEKDQSTYLTKHHSAIDSLLLIYYRYWRKSFFGFPASFDTLHRKELTTFLNHQPTTKKRISPSDTSGNIDKYLKEYISSKRYHTQGFGNTGKYSDLLVWRKQTDTVYHFTVNNEKIDCPIVFMEDFVTLGWEEYATADRLFPGGWATDESLYCVKSAYDLKSESFSISYLAHEGRHFNDYKLFQGLSAPNLEYRAKLTELSMLDKELWNTLTFFIASANADTKDSHQLADYYAVRDLSKALFKTDFEKDIEKWKKIPVQKIHSASAALLIANTNYLKKNKSYVN